MVESQSGIMTSHEVYVHHFRTHLREIPHWFLECDAISEPNNPELDMNDISFSNDVFSSNESDVISNQIISLLRRSPKISNIQAMPS